VKTVQQAWNTLMALGTTSRPEIIPIAQAVGKIAFENITASCDSPPFSLSRYDGYALGENNSNEWFDIITENSLTAGHVFKGTLKPQQALPIMTGAPLPEGTHYILPAEHCEVTGKRIRPLMLEKTKKMALKKGQNFRKGERYIAAGECITPLHVAFLAMDGKSQVKVYSKPRLSIISTGDELSDVTEKNPGNGHIRNSHPDMIYSMLSANGILTQSEIIGDTPALMRERFTHYINTDEDVIITTGGLGKGVRDFTRMTLQETGCLPLFEGIAAWPVGTFSVYRIHEKIIFSCPGGLVSAILLVKLFMEPFLKKIQGWRPLDKPGPFSWVKLSDIPAGSFRLSVEKKGWIRFVKAHCCYQDNSPPLCVTPLMPDDSLLKLNAFIVIDNIVPPDGRVKVFKLWN